MTSHVAANPNVTELAQNGVAFHNAALDGNKEAAEKAIDCFEQLEQNNPGNAYVISYLGSSNALKARYSKSPIDKMRYANLGLDKLDCAVELAPDDFVVRYIRWRVGIALPGLFGRQKTASEDLRKLDVIFKAAPLPGIAKEMVPAYTMLVEREPDNPEWVKMKAKAENLAQLANDQETDSYLTERVSMMSRKDPVVARAMAMMLEDKSTVPNLEQLADSLSMSSIQLIRLFKKETGLPPMAWLRREKLYFVRNELARGEKILYLAAKYGFSDHPHLSRHFKTMFGYTPSAYKRYAK